MTKSSTTNYLRHISIGLCLLLLSGHISAQTSIKLFQEVTVTKQNPTLSTNMKYLSVDKSALSSLLNSWHVVIKDIPLPLITGIPHSVDLDLTEFTVIGENTKIFYVKKGERIFTSLPTVRTFRGTIKGNPNTLAYIAAQPNGNISGFIRFDGLDNFMIETSSTDNGYTSMITPVSAIPNFSTFIQCGADDELKYSPNQMKHLSSPKISTLQAPSSPLTVSQTCVVACDVDNDGYGLLGSSTADATNFVATCIAAISAVYESEIDVAMSLGDVNIFTTPDPYTGSTLDDILNSFTNNYQDQGGNSRSIAHLFSGKNIPSGAVGLAWLDVLCDNTRGYAVTNISGNQSPGYAEYIAAHEMGHNVGSKHTHDCGQYPPSGVDHCAPAEGGCSWSTQSVKGSIMSYCNSKNFSFKAPNDLLAGSDGLRVVNVLKDGIAAASCLIASAKITVNDTVIDFAKTLYGTSRDTTINAIVTNSGSDVPLKVTGVTFDQENPGEFALKNPPVFPITLSFGQSINLTLTFKPIANGIRTATMHILHNAQGGMSGVTLNGIGAAPVAIASNDSLDFGVIHDWNQHDSAIYYVTNTGDGPLVIIKDSLIENTNKEFSVISGGHGLTVAPGDSGKITIGLKPKSNGQKIAYLDVVSNDPRTQGNAFTELTLLADVLKSSGGVAAQDDVSQLLLSPNPFSGRLQIEIRAGNKYAGENISLAIFDDLGRKVSVMDGGKLSSSSTTLSWQPEAFIAQGSYTLVAKIGSEEIVKQIIYIK